MNEAVMDAPAAADAAHLDDDALTKVDPAYRTVLRIVAILWCLPVLIGVGIIEIAQPFPVLRQGTFLFPALLIAAWIVIRLPMRRYIARGYAMSEDRLRVVRGLLFRSDTVVPFGRVQHLDVHQGPLERAFGLATLVLHTAGNHNASVAQPGLRHDDAVTMREAIRAHIKREAL